MKRYALAVSVATLVAVVANAQLKVTSQRGVQHFNPKILDATVDDPVQALQRLRPTDVAPSAVVLQVASNRYVGATLRYPKDIPVKDVVRSIEDAFRQCRKSKTPPAEAIALWRNEESGFAIVLTETKKDFFIAYSGTKVPPAPSLKDLPETATKVNLKSL